MKVFVTRASKWLPDGEVREYKDLNECVETLLSNEDFKGFAPGVIISRIDDIILPERAKSCDYEVEIYDSFIE